MSYRMMYVIDNRRFIFAFDLKPEVEKVITSFKYFDHVAYQVPLGDRNLLNESNAFTFRPRRYQISWELIALVLRKNAPYSTCI